MRVVPTPPYLEDPGGPAQMFGLEKVLKSLHISKIFIHGAQYGGAGNGTSLP